MTLLGLDLHRRALRHRPTQQTAPETATIPRAQRSRPGAEEEDGEYTSTSAEMRETPRNKNAGGTVVMRPNCPVCVSAPSKIAATPRDSCEAICLDGA